MKAKLAPGLHVSPGRAVNTSAYGKFVGQLFVPSMFFPKDPRAMLDKFMADVAPAFRPS